MSDLTINIKIPGNETFENTRIPADYLVEEVIDELIDALNLPRVTEDRQLVSYELFSVSRQLTLLPHTTLVASGVQNGDTLALVDSKAPQPIEPYAPQPIEADQRFVEVVLSVLDINKSELVLLELDQQIGDVIRHIVNTYNLPSRGKFNELKRYRLSSKALGKDLNHSETLRQERIPQLDRLTLSREEIAGGPPPLFERELLGPLSASGDTDLINCTVFAPPSILQGDSCLIQVFTHLLEHASIIKAAAKEFDEHSLRRGSTDLNMIIERGSTLTFHLSVPGLEVDDPVQKLVWNGAPKSVQFGLKAPRDQWIGAFIGTVRISYDQIPVGHIKFKIAVTNSNQAANYSSPTVEACVYRKAFVSYASEDRVEVLKRVQMLARLRIEVFHDILKLEPGQRWERVLYLNIADCDLFFLFWSSAAKKSEWVIKEVRYALWLKKGNDFAPPEIIPVVIEGPPIVPPPEELAHLHFNDQFLYFIVGSQRGESQT